MTITNFLKLFIVFYLLVGLVNPLNSYANTTHTHPNSLNRIINRLIAKFHLEANTGIIVQAMDNGHRLYSQHANHEFVPASTLKLLTATAALIYWGHNFHFTTRLLANATPTGSDNFFGNLWLQFSGDPFLTRRDLDSLLHQLRNAHIRTIHGNLFIDDTRFDQVNYGPGWMWDELNFCYAAPVSSVIINKNCIHAELRPGHQIGATAELSMLSGTGNNQLVSILNSVTTGNKGPDCKVNLKSSSLNTYDLSGCIPHHHAPQALEIAVKNVRLYIKRLIQISLKKQGIRLKGRIVFDRTSSQAQFLLAQHHSPPLRQMLSEMLKNSDNMVAEALYKRLGADYLHKQGTWENGAKAVEAILSKKISMDFKQIALVDGSGVSRYNLITPNQMMQLLSYIYHSPSLAATILPALPCMGVDGTLADRLANTNLLTTVADHLPNICAKTGTMTGVSALAGYVVTTGGRPLAFVLNANGFLAKIKQYHKLEDAIAVMLMKFPQKAHWSDTKVGG